MYGAALGPTNPMNLMHDRIQTRFAGIVSGLLATAWCALPALCRGENQSAAGPSASQAEVSALRLPTVLEREGPVTAPSPSKTSAGLKVSGQGFWTFAATEGVLPIPEEAKPFVKGAHATIVVDAPRDTVYWGLKKVGWVAFSQRLTQSRVVKGDPVYASGNLHGADLLYREGQLPLVAVADDEQSAVYLSDTTFEHPTRLDWPQGGPYQSKKDYHPTDVAFLGGNQLVVGDGYGQAYLMPGTVEPFAYQGIFEGGKVLSKTPHGITYDSATKTLLISARPEAQIKRWSIAQGRVVEVLSLPPGSTVCDVDVWGDYAVAPCLDGPSQTPGPIYIVNLKKHAIVSTIRPKTDLGFSEARHLHDAAWYFMPNGGKKELCILFTFWNPGGIGAIKLVDARD